MRLEVLVRTHAARQMGTSERLGFQPQASVFENLNVHMTVYAYYLQCLNLK